MTRMDVLLLHLSMQAISRGGPTRDLPRDIRLWFRVYRRIYECPGEIDIDVSLLAVIETGIIA